MRRRAEEPDVAVLARLDESGFLAGRTYLGSLLFFVPRSLWPDKPRTAGAYNNHYNFARTYVTHDFPRGWGIPVGGPTEAFWNFGWVGVLLIFAAVGATLRILFTIAKRGGGRGCPAVLLALGLLYLNGTGDGLTRFAQHASSLVLIALTARSFHALTTNSRRAEPKRSALGSMT
jgi:hypothetical protein